MDQSKEDVVTDASTDVSLSLAEFLQASPPGSSREVIDAVTVAEWINPKTPKQVHLLLYLNMPSLRLPCDHSECGGIQKFDAANRFGQESLARIDDESGDVFARYLCRSCRHSEKVFSLRITPTDASQAAYKQQSDEARSQTASERSSAQWYSTPLAAMCFKYGEYPFFGPTTPGKLLSVLRPQHDLFIRGRRCEAQGLGIGAYAYYRRIVEEKWRSLIEEIEKVARNSGAPANIVETINQAGKEQRFAAAVDKIGDILPAVLLMNGHNPLKLLHRALSHGVHNLTDEQCLELAGHIRFVLAALAERIAQSIADKRELDAAVSALLNIKTDNDKQS